MWAAFARYAEGRIVEYLQVGRNAQAACGGDENVRAVWPPDPVVSVTMCQQAEPFAMQRGFVAERNARRTGPTSIGYCCLNAAPLLRPRACPSALGNARSSGHGSRENSAGVIEIQRLDHGVCHI